MTPKKRKILVSIGAVAALAVIVALIAIKDAGRWVPSPLEQFVIKTEAKYRRDESQDDVAVHFVLGANNTIVVNISSLVGTDGVKIRSIGEAASELVKRLVEEDKTLNQGQINYDLVYKTRTAENTQ